MLSLNLSAFEECDHTEIKFSYTFDFDDPGSIRGSAGGLKGRQTDIVIYDFDQVFDIAGFYPRAMASTTIEREASLLEETVVQYLLAPFLCSIGEVDYQPLRLFCDWLNDPASVVLPICGPRKRIAGHGNAS